jgi:hypothetical protein
MDNLSDEDDDEAIVSTIYDDLNNGQVLIGTMKSKTSSPY